MRQRFIQSFSTSGTEQTAIDNKELGKPYVAYIEDGRYIDWNTKGIDYAGMPLTFEIISGGTILWASSRGQAKTIEYSKDAGSTWEQITSTSEGAVINVVPGDKLIFKGNTSIADNIYNWVSFRGTAIYNVYGNINSIRFWDNYISGSITYNAYVYYGLFKDSGIYDASNLYLPEVGAEYMYYNLFDGSAHLVKTPRLRSETMYRGCYGYMFKGCTSLVDAPELPATTMAMECYAYMFHGCTSLVEAPVLPATALASYCYGSMFQKCTSLTVAPELPATSLERACYRGMFAECTSLQTAPVLNADVIATMSYEDLFISATSLNYVVCLATDYSATQAVRNWMLGVSPTGTFVKHPNATWASRTIPRDWTVIDADI